MTEVLDHLGEAERFRNWVADQKPDESLVHNYIREISAGSWVERLPSKTLRWAFISSLGTTLGSLIAGPAGGAAGIALAGADALIIERILRGWKPNQFIEQHLRPFVSEPEGKR